MDIMGNSIEVDQPGGRLLIRPDLSPSSGMISLANCRELARRWPGTNQVCFILSAFAPALVEKRIAQADIECFRLAKCGSFEQELSQLNRYVAKWRPVAVILDGDRHAKCNLAALHSLRTQVVCLQDPEIAHRPELYIRRTNNHYVLDKSIASTVRRLAVIIGGRDGDGHATCILNALSRFKADLFSVDLCIDAANLQAEALRELASCHRQNVRIHRHVSRIDALLPKIDLGIVNFGTGCFPLACHGIPMIALSSCSDPPQLRESLINAGAVSVVETGFVETDVYAAIGHLIRHRLHRQQLSQSARSLVDGNGADRIVKLVSQHVSSLRKAS